MDLNKMYLLIRLFLIFFVAFTLSSCNELTRNEAAHSILNISVESSEVISPDEFNDLLKGLPKNSDNENVYYILSKAFFMPNARNSAIAVNKQNNTYDAVIIHDGIPDDDSVSGFRYDIKMQYTDNENWQFIEVKQSWRCWQDRGHREFSILPCS